MNRRLIAIAVLLAWISLFTGCAKYEYLVVEPATFAQTIGPKGEAVIERPPLEYRFIHAGSRLGVRIANTTDQPMTLIGEKSYVVDAAGQTHQMEGGAIAPHSFIAFGLPPAPRVYRSAGPRLSVGVGIGSYSGGAFGGYAHDDPFRDPFGYGYPYEVYEGPTWEWETGEVRLNLVYEREGADPLEHEFVLMRRKIEGK